MRTRRTRPGRRPRPARPGALHADGPLTARAATGRPGSPKSNAVGATSEPACALKYAFGRKPIMFAKMHGREARPPRVVAPARPRCSACARPRCGSPCPRAAPAGRGSSALAFSSGYFSTTTMQALQRAREALLRLLELREGRRVVRQVRRRRSSTWPTLARACVTASSVSFSKLGRALHGRHQVGDEVRAALVDVLHLAPLGVHGLRGADEAVVGGESAASGHQHDQQHDPERDPLTHSFPQKRHDCSLSILVRKIGGWRSAR